MFTHYDIVWCNPNSFSCKLHNANQHGRTFPPPCIWDILRKSQPFSCTPIHYHVCRIVQPPWIWVIINLYVILIYSHLIHVHQLFDSLNNSHSFSCMLYNVNQHRMTPYTHTHPPCLWVILNYSQSFPCIIMTYMFTHYDKVWCNPNSFSCKSYNVNPHGRTFLPLHWYETFSESLSHSHAFPFILRHVV